MDSVDVCERFRQAPQALYQHQQADRLTGWWHIGKPCMVGCGSMQLQPCAEYFICSKWPIGCAITSLIYSECWRPSICLCLLCVSMRLCVLLQVRTFCLHTLSADKGPMFVGVLWCNPGRPKTKGHSSNLHHGETYAA
jgi:hypothetical protein